MCQPSLFVVGFNAKNAFQLDKGIRFEKLVKPPEKVFPCPPVYSVISALSKHGKLRVS